MSSTLPISEHTSACSYITNTLFTGYTYIYIANTCRMILWHRQHAALEGLLPNLKYLALKKVQNTHTSGHFVSQ